MISQPIYELELDNEDWSFNIVGLWKDEKGYYLGTDSGCSCPIPWESHTADDLTGPLTAEQAREETASLIATRSEYVKGPDPDDVDWFLGLIT